MIYTVLLEDLEFFARHGLYPDERIKGNTFFVNVKITNSIPDEYNFGEIETTTDYEVISRLVGVHMQNPRELMEEVVHAIINDLEGAFPRYLEIEVSLSKSNPPIEQKCRRSTITLKKINSNLS